MVFRHLKRIWEHKYTCRTKINNNFIFLATFWKHAKYSLAVININFAATIPEWPFCMKFRQFWTRSISDAFFRPWEYLNLQTLQWMFTSKNNFRINVIRLHLAVCGNVRFKPVLYVFSWCAAENRKVFAECLELCSSAMLIRVMFTLILHHKL